MGEGGRALIAIVSSIVGLSLVAVVLSTRSNTASVIGAGGTALASVLSAATAPVTGGSSASSIGSALGGALGGYGSNYA
jgi:hypothetical protein